ncbi:MAG: bifunctional [glutamate--ammonia ligase]-adenylyl-L-tyrosine phosphorylase/[glutamate--ammonia-ligase] adenylyltransferase, partial [Sulfuriferula sp.]
RDLAGMADVHEVMRMCSDLATVTVRHALAFHTDALAAIHGMPINPDGSLMQLAIIGMGKLGGGELNVSSDIDLVYLYADEGETAGDKPISYHQFFVLLAKKIGLAISEITADGFVFRVDTRLRPWGDAGPLAMSYGAFEDYLVAHGREWERYAWIKGLALSGSRLAELSAIVRPFVYRKYLDFNAFAAMRELHAQIRREVIRRDRVDNIKLGPGGIREIEFITQVFQLIRGGQLSKLQNKSTRAVLPMLAEIGSLPPDAVDELLAAYYFLRNLEHRLQYIDDAQTQMLPSQPDDQARIATSMGFADYAQFLVELNAHRAKVTRHFDQVFAVPQEDGATHPLSALWMGMLSEEAAISQLDNLGYDDAATVYQRLQQSRQGSRYVQLSDKTKLRLDVLVPEVIALAATLPPRDMTLARVMDLLEAVARRSAYLALLIEYPGTLRQLATLCAASPWAARYLANTPMLLDELIDARVLFAQPDWSVLRQQLHEQMLELDGDTEQQMDAMRHFRQRVTLHLLAQDIAGVLPLEQLSDYLSDLAALILAETIPLAWAGVRNRHYPYPKFAIVGYGKLGGRELGYASDLDMVFLYQDNAPDAAEHYARLAQRINTWLSSTTAAGILYETDLRLRPDGASGLLVSSVEAFSDYQQRHAWTWEHQALTRARFVAGDREVGELFEPIRCQILTQVRDAEKLRDDIRAMRQKMHDGHPNRTALFDLKHDAGGIVDVEFMVQYLVLAHSAQHRALTDNVGNLALLDVAAQLGLIDAAMAEQVRAAYRQFRQLQHSLRLQGADTARVDYAQVAPHAEAVKALWMRVFGSK